MDDKLKRPGKTQVDKNLVIQQLAGFVSDKTGVTADHYILDPEQLDQKITQYKRQVPWGDIATKLGVNKWKLYHWYYETFQRSIHEAISKDDHVTIKDSIRQAILRHIPLDKQFQAALKQKLSKNYHRSSFSVCFNNSRRQIVKKLRKEGYDIKESDQSLISVANSEKSNLEQTEHGGGLNTTSYEMKNILFPSISCSQPATRGDVDGMSILQLLQDSPMLLQVGSEHGKYAGIQSGDQGLGASQVAGYGDSNSYFQQHGKMGVPGAEFDISFEEFQ